MTKDPPPDRDRRTIRLMLIMVVIGWASALALMAFAAVFWDHSSA